MTLAQFVQSATDRLKKSGISSPRLDIELLVSHVLRSDRSLLYREPERSLTEPELTSLQNLLGRREQGEPIAYILESKDFYKDSFVVRPGVLVPRPETEHVVEEALRRLKHQEGPIFIMDWGCGSGCIGLSLLRDLPEARLVGIDVSPQAVALSRENSRRLNLDDRSYFLQTAVPDLTVGDLPEEMRCGFHLVVTNPPYIASQDENVQESVRKFEPHEALFSDQEGFAALYEWSQRALSWLRPGGAFVTEIGAGQSAKLIAHLESLKSFKDISMLKDYAGWDRVVSCQRSEVEHG